MSAVQIVILALFFGAYMLFMRLCILEGRNPRMRKILCYMMFLSAIGAAGTAGTRKPVTTLDKFVAKQTDRLHDEFRRQMESQNAQVFVADRR
ncbi:MAG TPA: hypothetical protein VNC50_16765 [Planctomycetia bacterium]|nr:hypothetical protein [Planctomycetia bacterium]